MVFFLDYKKDRLDYINFLSFLIEFCYMLFNYNLFCSNNILSIVLSFLYFPYTLLSRGISSQACCVLVSVVVVVNDDDNNDDSL